MTLRRQPIRPTPDQLPLVLLSAAFIADVAGRLTGRRRWMKIGRLVAPLGGVCAVAAAGAGTAVHESGTSGDSAEVPGKRGDAGTGLMGIVGVLALSRLRRDRPGTGYLLASGALLAGRGYLAWRDRGGATAGDSVGFRADALVAASPSRSAPPPVDDRARTVAATPQQSPGTGSASSGAMAATRCIDVPNTTEDVPRVTLFGQLDDGSFAAALMSEGEVPYARYWRNAIDQVMVYVTPAEDQLDAILAALDQGRLDFSALQQYGGTKGGYSSIPV